MTLHMNKLDFLRGREFFKVVNVLAASTLLASLTLHSDIYRLPEISNFEKLKTAMFLQLSKYRHSHGP